MKNFVMFILKGGIEIKMCLPFLKLFLHQLTKRFYPTMKKTKLVPCTVVRVCGCSFLFF